MKGPPVPAVLSHFGRFVLPVALANHTAPSGNNLQPRLEITLPNDRLTGDSSSPTGKEPHSSAQHPGSCHTCHLPRAPWEPSQGRCFLPPPGCPHTLWLHGADLNSGPKCKLDKVLLKESRETTWGCRVVGRRAGCSVCPSLSSSPVSISPPAHPSPPATPPFLFSRCVDRGQGGYVMLLTR